jgi:hypothetical protein
VFVSCDHGNELSGTVRDEEFFDQLSIYRRVNRLCFMSSVCTASVKLITSHTHDGIESV